jgi:hypothetical protein
MPGGRHAFYFVDKEPLVLWVAAALLLANTFLMLSLEFGSKFFLGRHVPPIVNWYQDNSIAIQFVLVAMLAAIFIFFRKRVHYVRRK